MDKFGLVHDQEFKHIIFDKASNKYKIKLHMTILNTLFKQNKKKGIKYTFDAEPLIDKLG